MKFVDVLDFGLLLAVPAVVGGFIAVLQAKAQTIEDVSQIGRGFIVTGLSRWHLVQLHNFAYRLSVDDFFVLGVVVILIGLVVFEIKIGTRVRSAPPGGGREFARFALLGYFIPDLLGLASIYLI